MRYRLDLYRERGKCPIVCGVALVFLLGFLAAGEVSAAPKTITRVSVDSDGNQGNNTSAYPAISADGRHVAFTSNATNLVPEGTNYQLHIFVHDRLAGETTLVSMDSAGNPGNGVSNYTPSISADGRYVAFMSTATNLVPDDTNLFWDVFVHDRRTGQTTRVSVDSEGNQGNGHSQFPAISADGRYVAFISGAPNLVPDDTNLLGDVFVHDRKTGQTTRVSVDSEGNQGNGYSHLYPSISADGRYVAFDSDASNLVPGGIGGLDIFVHDRQKGQTTRVSVDSNGYPGNNQSVNPSISADGRYVAFRSASTNLVPEDDLNNTISDVFVHDRQTGETTRVSVDSNGMQGNSGSWNPSISADGRYVAFWSLATNLVPGDVNGSHDVFVHDRKKGETTLVSVDSDGNPGNGHSSTGEYGPSAISGDGRYVAFHSNASNLVPGDTNGVIDVFVRQLPAPARRLRP